MIDLIYEKARDIIVEGRGSHFDSDVVDAFLALEDEFQRIAATFSKSSLTFHTPRKVILIN
jgi:putative two-component system response regulator